MVQVFNNFNLKDWISLLDRSYLKRRLKKIPKKHHLASIFAQFSKIQVPIVLRSDNHSISEIWRCHHKNDRNYREKSFLGVYKNVTDFWLWWSQSKINPHFVTFSVRFRKTSVGETIIEMKIPIFDTEKFNKFGSQSCNSHTWRLSTSKDI